MECTYLNVMSNLINISVGQNKLFLSQFKPYHQSKSCGGIIDNRAGAPICVLEDKDREKKLNLIHAFNKIFGGLCHVEYV